MVTIQQGIAEGTLHRMGEGGLRFHIAGFPVSVPLGGILGVLLIAYLWTPNFSEPGRSGITLAVVFAVLLYAGVLVHELAHAWAARAFGYPVHGITLWLLGGYTVYERRSSRPWPELVIAVIGPVSTLLLAAGCWVLAANTGGSVSLLFGALAWTNGLLGVLIEAPWFYEGLGMTSHGTAPALVLFSLVIPVFTFPLSPLMSAFSRRHEYEADAYAAQQTRAGDLVAALVKLYRDNAATLTPDPLYSTFYDSHPPAAARIAQLRAA